MSENRPFPNIPNDSKTTFELFKTKNLTKKLPLKIQKPKISLKSQNFRKQTLPNRPADSKTTFGTFQTKKSN